MKRRAKDRGIAICKRWQHSFWTFFKDMGPPPKNMVLDRIKNELGYSKENCRWATYKLSTENRRNTVWLSAFGTKMRIADFAKRVQCSEGLIYNRLHYGWTVEEMITKPKFVVHGFDRYGVPTNLSTANKNKAPK